MVTEPEYGEQILDNLSRNLTLKYGKGFSTRYLRSFRKFYLTIPDYEIWKSRFPNLTRSQGTGTLTTAANRASDLFLKSLSKELTAEFGNGFSYANLYNMRQFYLTYYKNEIFYTLCIKLPWSHNRLIMRVTDPKAREWYLREAAQEQWSVRQLERNINSFYYQRQLKNGNGFEGQVQKPLVSGTCHSDLPGKISVTSKFFIENIEKNKRDHGDGFH